MGELYFFSKKKCCVLKPTMNDLRPAIDLWLQRPFAASTRRCYPLVTRLQPPYNLHNKNFYYIYESNPLNSVFFIMASSMTSSMVLLALFCIMSRTSRTLADWNTKQPPSSGKATLFSHFLIKIGLKIVNQSHV